MAINFLCHNVLHWKIFSYRLQFGDRNSKLFAENVRSSNFFSFGILYITCFLPDDMVRYSNMMRNTSCQYSIPKLFFREVHYPPNCIYQTVSVVMFAGVEVSSCFLFWFQRWMQLWTIKKPTLRASAALLSQVVVLLQFATNPSTVRFNDSKDIIAFQFLCFRMTDQRLCLRLLFAARVIVQEDRVMTIKSLHLRLVNLAC